MAQVDFKALSSLTPINGQDKNQVRAVADSSDKKVLSEHNVLDRMFDTKEVEDEIKIKKPTNRVQKASQERLRRMDSVRTTPRIASQSIEKPKPKVKEQPTEAASVFVKLSDATPKVKKDVPITPVNPGAPTTKPKERPAPIVVGDKTPAVTYTKKGILSDAALDTIAGFPRSERRELLASLPDSIRRKAIQALNLRKKDNAIKGNLSTLARKLDNIILFGDDVDTNGIAELAQMANLTEADIAQLTNSISLEEVSDSDYEQLVQISKRFQDEGIMPPAFAMLKPAAKRNPIFTADSKYVADNRPHLMMQSKTDARKLLGHVYKTKATPKWFKGSPIQYRKLVADAVSKTYPKLKHLVKDDVVLEEIFAGTDTPNRYPEDVNPPFTIVNALEQVAQAISEFQHTGDTELLETLEGEQLPDSVKRLRDAIIQTTNSSGNRSGNSYDEPGLELSEETYEQILEDLRNDLAESGIQLPDSSYLIRPMKINPIADVEKRTDISQPALSHQDYYSLVDSKTLRKNVVRVARSLKDASNYELPYTNLQEGIEGIVEALAHEVPVQYISEYPYNELLVTLGDSTEGKEESIKKVLKEKAVPVRDFVKAAVLTNTLGVIDSTLHKRRLSDEYWVTPVMQNTGQYPPIVEQSGLNTQLESIFGQTPAGEQTYMLAFANQPEYLPMDMDMPNATPSGDVIELPIIGDNYKIAAKLFLFN